MKQQKITLAFTDLFIHVFYQVTTNLTHVPYHLLQVDHSRVNEFGYSGEMLDEAAKGKEVGAEGDSKAIKSEAEKKDD